MNDSRNQQLKKAQVLPAIFLMIIKGSEILYLFIFL